MSLGVYAVVAVLLEASDSGRAWVPELAATAAVSEDAVRAALQQLHDEGRCNVLFLSTMGPGIAGADWRPE